MKHFYIILFTILLISCSKDGGYIVLSKKLEEQPTTVVPVYIDTTISLRTQEISFSQNGVPTDSLYHTLQYSTAGALNYVINGVEHLILTPSLSTRNLSPLHFVKKDTNWIFTGSSDEIKLGNPRNYKIDNDGTIYYAEQGLEYSLNGKLPFGDLWKVTTNGDNLSWYKISNQKSFYHDVAIGDVNNDGKTDVIGAHLGTNYTDWLNEGLLLFLNKNSSFEEGRNMLPFTDLKQGGSATLIEDLDNDGKNEIIQGDYSLGNWRTFSDRFSLLIFKQTNGKYQSYVKSELGAWVEPGVGATSIKSIDYDKDGDLDMVVAYETNKNTNGVQIFENKGNLNFVAGQKIETSFSSNQFREFEIIDVNRDGYLDIVTHPFHYGNLFRTSDGIILQNNILINNKSKFEFLTKSLPVKINPGFMKGFYIKNNLKFIGVEYKDNKFKIHEVIVRI